MNQAPTFCIVCGQTPEPTERNHLALFACPSCGLMWRQTFDVSQVHYEEYSPNGSPAQRSIRLRNAEDRVYTLFKEISKEAVCDVGTGDGAFLEALRAAGGSGVGIEPSKEGREEAQKRGIPIVGEVFEDLAQAAKDKTFATISLFHVIEHVEQPERMLEIFFAALPKGGRLVLETPTMDSPVLRAREYKDPLIYPEHLYYFNEQNLTRLLSKKGFTVIKSGRRDYDQYFLPIRESLRRLLVPRGPAQPVRYIPAHGVRARVRAWLARRVVATGRLNYMWLIAQK